MKNKIIIISVLMIAVSSCASLPQPSFEIGVIDYSPLLESGIFVTESNSVSFDYTALGSIVAIEKGGWKNGITKRPSTETVFDGIIKELENIGANGLINLNVTFSNEITDYNRKIYVPTIVVKGMAIKTPNGKINKIEKKIIPDGVTLLGKIDNIDCWIIKEHKNGVKIGTLKELNGEQIRKAIRKFSLNKNITFNLKGKERNNDAYAGVDGQNIMLFKENKIIRINPK